MSLAVTHVVAPAAFGGLESVVASLVPAQHRAGIDVTIVGIFHSDPGGQPFWAEIAGSGVRAIPMVLPGRRYTEERRRVAELLAATGSGVVHTHGYRPDVVDAPVGRRMGLAAVTTVHGFTAEGWRGRLYEGLQRRAFRRFDAVVAVSEKLRRELARSGVSRTRLHTVRNAWAPTGAGLSRAEARAALSDLVPVGELPCTGPWIGWVGRFTPEKAPDVTIQAFADLVAGGASDARLVMVGDGSMRTRLASGARASCASRAHFVGVVPNAARILKAFDALVISSWTEGTPMILLEAMAARVPVVSTAVGGIPDVVSPAEARLVPAGDVAGLSHALRTVLSESEEATARARRAAARLARDFAVAPWVDRYARIYEACIAGRKR